MSKNLTRKISYGSAFSVGDQIIACGDARDTELVSRIVGTTKIKAVIADPPYGCRLVQNKAGFSQIKVPKEILNDDIQGESAYVQFSKDWILPTLSHLEYKNSFYIFNSDLMIFALREGMERAGVHFSQLLLWVKNQAVVGRRDYLPQFELIAHGWFGRHDILKAKDKSVLWFPRPSKSPIHPTTKPVPLIRRLILNSTAIGDTVYDCFLGSGTCAVAAQETKRRSIGIERDEDYVRAALVRMETTFGLKAELIK